MGIYIKDREMPTSCTNCFYAVHCEACVFKSIILKSDEIIFHIGKKPDNCPLIEVSQRDIDMTQ